MRRFAWLLCVAVIVPAGLALAGSNARAPLLAVITTKGQARLAELDPLTLRKIRTARFVLWSGAGPESGVWARSPDGSRLASAVPGGVTFVDVQHLRSIGMVKVGLVYSIDWASARTVLVEADADELAIDPVTLRVRWKRTLPMSRQAEAKIGSGLVLLSSSTGGYGPTTLTTIDTAGHMRSVLLKAIHSGYEDGTTSPGAVPDVAVDESTDTAFVIGGRDPVAEVDLRTMSVAYHDWPRAPASATHGVNGPQRTALWLGSGLIAVTGENDTVTSSGEIAKPAGLTILNTVDWTTRLIDPGATAVSQASGLLLTYGLTETTTGNTTKIGGDGLSGYQLDGTPRFHLFRRAPLTDVQVVGGLVYVQLKGTSIIEIPSGQRLRTVGAPRLTELLVTPLLH